jgi:alkylation response protein AidB-like acyl-CoA dehydrogenase
MSSSARPDKLILRRNDYTLSSDQEALQAAFQEFFRKESPVSVVRAAEPLGFDAALWNSACGMGAISMALPGAIGGDGASLLDLVLVAEQVGASIAPIPFTDCVVASRALARLERDDVAVLVRQGIEGKQVLGVAARPAAGTSKQLVASGAIAPSVLGLHDGELVLVTDRELPSAVANRGGVPLAWRGLDASAGRQRMQLATGDGARSSYETAMLEWRVLTAGCLVGMARAVLEQTVQFAKTRVAFGEPISTFQAISHPIASIEINSSAAQNLTRRAAWYLDHDPEPAGMLASAAYVFAHRTATHATEVGVHTQGGQGITLESDVPLYFNRVRSWANVLGDPGRELARAALQQAGRYET